MERVTRPTECPCAQPLCLSPPPSPPPPCLPCPHFSVGAAAQETTQVHNAVPLRPPAGARVAIIEFEDLECPDCARANPLLKQAAEQYKIPWVRHDFPLPQHDWSFQAAVNARWFDTIARSSAMTIATLSSPIRTRSRSSPMAPTTAAKASPICTHSRRNLPPITSSRCPS